MSGGVGRRRKCRNCGEGFAVTREWQLFCGTTCRQKWNYINSTHCFYCGESAGSRDHIHPIAARGHLIRKFDGHETVRACGQCNSILGANVFTAIEFRLRWLLDQYIKKYKLNKGAVEWEEFEVSELGPTLRSHIRKALADRHKAERRVSYGETVLRELLRLNYETDDGMGKPKDLDGFVESDPWLEGKIIT